jgi:predicted esterase
VPASSSKYEKAPLVVILHGASQNADRGFIVLRSLANEPGFLVLAPASKGDTWDAIEGSYGPDIDFIDRALQKTFLWRAIDPERIAVAGFSDGVSFALSIGLANGDLFTSVLGFSPGIVVPGQRAGKPPIFISHGRQDQILPIDECSRRIVPELQGEGYQVTYREFDGPHMVPPEVASEAMQWFMKPV